ncbi:hypothetical protein CDCA_CDCA06G1740 [Cyanidium caldarium]|uniref:Uncharacterized protein n=1 Tax=Cyanidium caldarium TaxID=2771 RepID=A0AAV9ITU4_CYACA|nr:hypothetical protein CDCA_CDCA06G1740 [Cyanidium caldarium]
MSSSSPSLPLSSSPQHGRVHLRTDAAVGGPARIPHPATRTSGALSGQVVRRPLRRFGGPGEFPSRSGHLDRGCQADGAHRTGQPLCGRQPRPRSLVRSVAGAAADASYTRCHQRQLDGGRGGGGHGALGGAAAPPQPRAARAEFARVRPAQAAVAPVDCGDRRRRHRLCLAVRRAERRDGSRLRCRLQPALPAAVAAIGRQRPSRHNHRPDAQRWPREGIGRPMATIWMAGRAPGRAGGWRSGTVRLATRCLATVPGAGVRARLSQLQSAVAGHVGTRVVRGVSRVAPGRSSQLEQGAFVRTLGHRGITRGTDLFGDRIRACYPPLPGHRGGRAVRGGQVVPHRSTAAGIPGPPGLLGVQHDAAAARWRSRRHIVSLSHARAVRARCNRGQIYRARPHLRQSLRHQCGRGARGDRVGPAARLHSQPGSAGRAGDAAAVEPADVFRVDRSAVVGGAGAAAARAQHRRRGDAAATVAGGAARDASSGGDVDI